MIRLNASLSYIAKLSKTMKWLKIKMPLSCQNCPVIDGRLTVECPICLILMTCLWLKSEYIVVPLEYLNPQIFYRSANFEHPVYKSWLRLVMGIVRKIWVD